MKNRITIEEAIQRVRDKYEFAKNHPRINDPIGYALYYTWDEIFEEQKRKENKRDRNS